MQTMTMPYLVDIRKTAIHESTVYLILHPSIRFLKYHIANEIPNRDYAVYLFNDDDSLI